MSKKSEQAQKKSATIISPDFNSTDSEATPNESGLAAAASKNKDEKVSSVKFWIDSIKDGNEEEIKASVAENIKAILKKYKLENYQTLMLFDREGSIRDLHLNRMYDAASSFEDKKDILLLLHSNGGSIEPAYLISKSLKAIADKKFVVAIPRVAKSAATLICLGADEIHMGLTSQLGPIDPQIGGLPALGLANSLDTLANLACKFPAASDMLSVYLKSKLDLRILGYFNRVAESAVQYGERLLDGKKLPNKTAHEAADHLVNHYKDHGFVIDYDEAKSLLGPQIMKKSTPEYMASNDIFVFLDLFAFVLEDLQNKKFFYIGGVEKGMALFDAPNKEK